MKILSKDKKNIARTKQLDPAAVILGKYLQGFIPADKYTSGVVIMTTDDIIAALGPMIDLDQATVSMHLSDIGFTCGYNNAGSFGWLMKPLG